MKIVVSGRKKEKSQAMVKLIGLAKKCHVVLGTCFTSNHWRVVCQHVKVVDPGIPRTEEFVGYNRALIPTSPAAEKSKVLETFFEKAMKIPGVSERCPACKEEQDAKTQEMALRRSLKRAAARPTYTPTYF